MIECCHRKAVRFQIEEELACKLLGVDNRWDIDHLLKAPFEIAPTEKFFIDYNLPCSNEAEGDWGKVRTLNMTEFLKYAPEFCELLNHRGIDKSELRLVEKEDVNMNDFEKFLVDRTFNGICHDYYANFQCGSKCPFYNNSFTDLCDCGAATYAQQYEMLKQYFEKNCSNIYKERP